MNFGEMVALITDDLIDERLTNGQIQNAINQALKYYSRKTFYFNTIKDNIAVNPTQEYYTTLNSTALFTNHYSIQIIKFTPSGEIEGWEVKPKTDAVIEGAIVGNTSQRVPTHYSYAQMQLRLYPVPNVAGNLSIIATYQYPFLSGDTATHVFLERADELIRQAAKRYIAFNILHDQPLGDRCAAMEAEEFASLRAETMARDPVEPLVVDETLVLLPSGSVVYDIRSDV